MDVVPISCIITSSSDVEHVIAGFAFVYFEDDRDASDAIRGLDNHPFGYDRRRLSVEWARVCYGSFSLRFHTILCLCPHNDWPTFCCNQLFNWLI